ncbi:hypothetical protein GZH49_19345 [Nocardia terpenica]|uniref:hypothetical protein n=1 Tax=Nocardia terpenica TaxID=455432 RepID=UPI002FE2EE5A
MTAVHGGYPFEEYGTGAVADTVGALLIESDLGAPHPLRMVYRMQSAVRRFLLDYSAYLVSKADPDLFQLREAVRGGGYSRSDRIKSRLFHEYSSRDHQQDSIDDVIAYTKRAFDGIFIAVPDVLAVTSSATVNPWIEVVQAAGEALGSATLARVAWLTCKNANSILDFALRISTFKAERNMRIVELKAVATRRECQAMVEIIEDLDRIVQSAAAHRILTTAFEGAEALGTVRMREITQEEADARRRRLLRIIRDDDSEGE